jgi:hypothetical protein
MIVIGDCDEWRSKFRKLFVTRMAVFWVVAPCSLVEVYQRFRGCDVWYYF